MDERRLAAVLIDFARTLTADFSLEATLDVLAKRVPEVIPVTGAGVLLMDSETDHHFVAATDDVILRIERLQVDLGEGPCLEAYRTGERVGVPDLASDRRFPQFSAQAATAGLGAVFSFPLRLYHDQIGALELYAAEPLELADDDVTGAQTLADVMAAYLFNAAARTEAAESMATLRQQALHDPLTGVPNRTLLRDRLDRAVHASERSRTLVGVLFLDVDRLKAINDGLGHQAGDEALQGIVERVREVLRPGDTLGRLSGDEFVVVCDGLTSSSQAQQVADRIHASLEEPLPIAGRAILVSVSIGIAFAGHGHGTAADALSQADAAMYEAKDRGGGSRVTASVVPLSEAGRRRDLDGDLVRALDQGDLRVEYQPIVDATTDAWTGVEALLRWSHPRLGPVPPREILAAAERLGLTLELARWMLRRACRDAHRWQRHDGLESAAYVATNASAHELLHPGYAAMVRGVIDQDGVPPGRLCIELTEDILLDDDVTAGQVLRELADLGIVLALDGFGTGYSSLAHLKAFPVTVVKIDRSFVSGPEESPVDEVIVAAVTALAHRLGISVVAEGVETAEQLHRVRRAGSERFQGYLYSRPVPVDALERLMRTKGPAESVA
jgi:diguanylate cyclase (GGDEF)-like protein